MLLAPELAPGRVAAPATPAGVRRRHGRGVVLAEGARPALSPAPCGRPRGRCGRAPRGAGRGRAGRGAGRGRARRGARRGRAGRHRVGGRVRVGVVVPGGGPRREPARRNLGGARRIGRARRCWAGRRRRRARFRIWPRQRIRQRPLGASGRWCPARWVRTGSAVIDACASVVPVHVIRSYEARLRDPHLCRRRSLGRERVVHHNRLQEQHGSPPLRNAPVIKLASIGWLSMRGRGAGRKGAVTIGRDAWRCCGPGGHRTRSWSSCCAAVVSGWPMRGQLGRGRDCDGRGTRRPRRRRGERRCPGSGSRPARCAGRRARRGRARRLRRHRRARRRAPRRCWRSGCASWRRPSRPFPRPTASSPRATPRARCCARSRTRRARRCRCC